MASSKEIIEILIKVRDDATKKLESMNKVVTKTGRTTKAFDNQLQKVNKAQGQIQAMTKKNQIQFAGWAMSIMFAGMALQRIFNQIKNFGMKTFQDIQHSVEGSVTGFDMLQGSIKYLGFTIGAALEPLAEKLIPVIDFIANIVEQNPKITAEVLKWTGILGTAAAAGGAIVLAKNGFRELGMKVGGATDKVNALGRAIGLIVAIEVAIEIATSDDAKAAFTKSVGKLLFAAGLLAGAATPIGAAAITIGVVLELISEDFKDKLLKVAGGVFGIIVSLIAELIDVILAPILATVNILIGAYNKITGSNLKELSFMALSEPAKRRTADLFRAGFGDEEANTRLETKGEYKPQFFVQVELDGEQIAKNTSTRIMTEAEAYTY